MPDYDYMDYMRKMNMPMQYSPMMEMPQDQLESMYPRCYYIIHPEVERHCDMMCAKYGTMHTPTREQMDYMVDDIDNRVGSDVDADYQDGDDTEERQLGGFGGGFGGGFHGRRRFRRDLITILLLRSLLRRRRHPHFGGFPFGGGFGGGFGRGYGEYPY